LAYETLLVERKEGAGLITLNRPEKLNALSSTVFAEFERALTELERDDSVRVLLVTGAGQKAFSAGADIHEMVEASEGARRMTAGTGDWLKHLAFCKKPTIGVMNGLAYGGGALMASAFDMRIGCERSSFRFLAVTYGRINSTWTLPLIVGMPMAKELLLTGRVVGAEEAFRIGLLNRLVPSADLMKSAMETAGLIAKSDPATVQLIRRILNKGVGMGWEEMMTNEYRLIAESLKPPPPRESFQEFLKRNPLDDTGRAEGRP
jgi:enoyl-CoA hydratase/carnithine racemase